MNTDFSWILPFTHLSHQHKSFVGGKNASLGEMIRTFSSQEIRVPEGFAVTTHAFHAFLEHNHLTAWIQQQLQNMGNLSGEELARTSHLIRQRVMEGEWPEPLQQAIQEAFEPHGQGLWAVRSSATAEDGEEHSFAGQQDTFLNVAPDHVLYYVRQVFASLYNERALSYRIHKGLLDQNISMAVGVQRMICSEDMRAGVMFTVHPESGFSDVVLIQAAYGLGETVVQGAINPDEFWVFKPALRAGHQPLLRRSLGSKHLKMTSAPCVPGQSEEAQGFQEVSLAQRHQFCLTDEDVIQLTQYGLMIEQHYGYPVDIEWAKESATGAFYILQARPATMVRPAAATPEDRYTLKKQGKVLAQGQAIGQKIGVGPVRLIRSFDDIHLFQPGDVLLTETTHPQWEPVMKQAAAIITDRGGRTCHAAIVARELGIPAVVGCEGATHALQEGMTVTVSCAEGEEGYIYEGALPFECTLGQALATELPKPPVPIMINLGNPQQAFQRSHMPQAGVGLARLEFIINRYVGIHPQAALLFSELDETLQRTIQEMTYGYASPRHFYVAKLTEGISTIAAAFYPKPVIVRCSDFKSHEYRKLIGGDVFEPDEENPMLGFRGVSRYLSPTFAPAFGLECEALRSVRDEMGLDNVQIMIPFVRTVAQAQKVVKLLADQGLGRGQRGLKIIMMCELPSNALLAEQFLEYFDGFSIGSNDMTQLTLGLDRDSGSSALNHDFDERNPAVLFLLERAIKACRAQGKYIGICGQGPSDHLDFAHWLVEQGVSSLSLNPDCVLPTWNALTS